MDYYDRSCYSIKYAKNKYLHDIDKILSHKNDNGDDLWAIPDRNLLKGAPFTTLERTLYLLELGVDTNNLILKNTAELILSTWKDDKVYIHIDFIKIGR